MVQDGMDDPHRDLINWLRRLDGQVRGVAGMLERGEPIHDALVQLVAIKSSVVQLSLRLVEAQVQTCMKDYLESGDEEPLEQLKASLGMILERS